MVVETIEDLAAEAGVGGEMKDLIRGLFRLYEPARDEFVKLAATLPLEVGACEFVAAPLDPCRGPGDRMRLRHAFR